VYLIVYIVAYSVNLLSIYSQAHGMAAGTTATVSSGAQRSPPIERIKAVVLLCYTLPAQWEIYVYRVGFQLFFKVTVANVSLFTMMMNDVNYNRMF